MIKRICLILLFLILCSCKNSYVLDTEIDYIIYQDKQIKLEVYVKDFVNQFNDTSCSINYKSIQKEWKNIQELKAAPLYIDCGEELTIMANLLSEEGKLFEGVIKEWTIMSNRQISVSINNKIFDFNKEEYKNSGIPEVLSGYCYIQGNLNYCEYNNYGIYIGDITEKLNYIKIVRYI